MLQLVGMASGEIKAAGMLMGVAYTIKGGS